MSKISEAELNRIARNRERALMLKGARLQNHPYARTGDNEKSENGEKSNGVQRYLQLFFYNFSLKITNFRIFFFQQSL